MSIRPRVPSKSVVFAGLMIAAVVASLLPVAWTRWVRGIFQPLALLQSGVAALVRSGSGGDAEAPGPAAPPVTPEELARLQTENRQLQRELGQQSLYVAELEKRLNEITGIRDQLRNRQANLILAPVIAYDASLQQETLLISKGSAAGIVKGQWVAAAAEPGQTDGRKLLARQWLIGRISEVQPYSSRVQLATDGRFKEEVRVAKVLPNGAWQPLDHRCILFGRGGGRMAIEQATQDYYKLGYQIVLVPASAELPAPFTLGRIESSRPLEQTQLHFDLEARLWGEPRRLEYVYVIAVGS